MDIKIKEEGSSDSSEEEEASSSSDEEEDLEEIDENGVTIDEQLLRRGRSSSLTSLTYPEGGIKNLSSSTTFLSQSDDDGLDAFAVMPKIEIDPEADSEGNRRKTRSSSVGGGKTYNKDILCLLCAKGSEPWPMTFLPQLPKVSSNFCYLFDLRRDDFQEELSSKQYCSPCQGLLQTLVQLYNELEEIKSRISTVKSDIESTVQGSLASRNGDPQPRPTPKSSQSVKTILTQRITITEFGGSQTPAPWSDDDGSHEDEDEFSPPPSPEVAWKEEASDDNSAEGTLSRVTLSPKSRAQLRKRKLDRVAITSISTRNSGKKKKKRKKGSAAKTVKCDLCFRMFPDEVRMSAHVKRYHEGEKRNYVCKHPGCPKSYRCLTELEAHKKIHWGETAFVCEICFKGFELKNQLTVHQKNIHFTDCKNFKCDQCDKKYLYESGLQTHKKTHAPIREYPFVCEVCGTGYVSISALNAHKRVKHSGENPFICDRDKCGKVFSSKMALTAHQYTHTKEWPYYCAQCGVGAVSKSRLELHIKRKHESTYECEICHKKMAYKSSYNKHMLLHSGEKNFECDQCGKKFLDNYKLKVHQSVHIGDRIHQCELCDKRFCNQPYMRRHMKNTHPKAYYETIEDRKRSTRHADFVDTTNVNSNPSQDPSQPSTQQQSLNNQHQPQQHNKGLPTPSHTPTPSQGSIPASSSSEIPSSYPVSSGHFLNPNPLPAHVHNTNNSGNNSNIGGGNMNLGGNSLGNLANLAYIDGRIQVPMAAPPPPSSSTSMPQQIYHQTFSSNQSMMQQGFLNFHNL